MKEATIAEVLDELARAGEITQVEPCRTPVPDVLRVPTLHRGVYVDASSQLLERFRYAQSWVGPCDLRFVSIHELARVWDEGDVLRLAAEGRRESWENALMAAVPPAQVSLIAIGGPNAADEVYLIWHAEGEPEVVSYVANIEACDSDLKQFFLEWV